MLDQVAQRMERLVDARAGLSMAAHGDDGDRVARLGPVTDTVGIVTLVGKQRAGRGQVIAHDEELTEDYRDMICAETALEVEARRKAFLRKWRLKCRAVADSLEEAGDRLFAFTRLDPSQWEPARTTNAIERLNEEFRRRVKTQTMLPCEETVPMLLWALLASGQIQMRKVDGWEPLSQPIARGNLDLAA